MAKKIQCVCLVCNKNINGFANLKRHILEHNITHEEYHLTYINDRKTCKTCNSGVRFLDLRRGFSERCGHCVTQSQWDGDIGNTRREKFSDFLKENPMPNGGRKPGSKNKKPFVMTPAILARLEKLHSIPHTWNRNPDKIEKHRATMIALFQTNGDEIFRKRRETAAKNLELFSEPDFFETAAQIKIQNTVNSKLNAFFNIDTDYIYTNYDANDLELKAIEFRKTFLNE